MGRCAMGSAADTILPVVLWCLILPRCWTNERCSGTVGGAVSSARCLTLSDLPTRFRPAEAFRCGRQQKRALLASERWPPLSRYAHDIFPLTPTHLPFCIEGVGACLTRYETVLSVAA